MKTKEKQLHSDTNIVGETYRQIVENTTNPDVIEQANEEINPDPNSLDSRG
ncbi:MAG: hypothetical protein LBN18_04115 [Dysgonamonadaceae bacterium]|jgi:hypothetical protein|nr:hypothetical protein [Dysgonamonadaceae bacterium]